MHSAPVIDFHTHSTPAEDDSVLRVLNCSQEIKKPSQTLFTAGIHPLWINEKRLILDFKKLRNICTDKSCTGIGETGMDKRAPVNMDIQEDLFKKHVRLADNLCKPLIIHWVAPFQKLINIRKHFKTEIPWVLHGFRKKRELAEQLIKNGFYLSLSHKLLKSETGRDVISNLPVNRIFLESDDDRNCSRTITEVYETAASVIGITDKELRKIIFKNFLKISPVKIPCSAD